MRVEFIRSGQFYRPSCPYAISLVFIILFLLGPASLLRANDLDASEPSLIQVTTPKGLTIQAELADTAEKRAIGLMERSRLPKNRGMLFTFPQPGYWSFWMKNTRIPLDIIWLDQHKTIVHIEHSLPTCRLSGNACPQYAPLREALYVLELRGGTAESLGLRTGAGLSFDVPSYIPFQP